MIKKIILGSFAFLNITLAQTTTFPTNGAPHPIHTIYAFTNCTLHVNDETVLQKSTLLIQDGKIIEAGNVAIPKSAIVTDLKGKHVYPSFIETYSAYGMPEVKKGGGKFFPQMESNVQGAYGQNQAIKSNVNALDLFTNNDKEAEELRRLGFGTVLTSQKDGIVRGSGAVVNLNARGEKENNNFIKEKAAGLYSFSKGTSTQDYPESQMGAIALLRQSLYDAKWYKTDASKKEFNITLESLNSLTTLPAIFECNDKLNLLRADKIGDEFKLKFILKGGGDEYQRIQDVVAANCPLIIPVNFPDAYDVEDPFDAENVSYPEMKHWEMAPANASYLQDNGVKFCFTTSDLKERKVFLKNIQKAIEYGLTPANALKALTRTPAELLGIADKVGELKKGMKANFIITSGELFTDGTSILENWIDGTNYAYGNVNAMDYRGTYKLQLGSSNYAVNIKGEMDKIAADVILKDTTKTALSFAVKNDLLSMGYYNDSVNYYRFNGIYNDSTKSFTGKALIAEGKWADFKLVFEKSFEEVKKDAKKDAKKRKDAGEVMYPFVAFGKPEKQENLVQKFKNRNGAIIIKNVTVWTNEADGVLKNKDVYINDGRIVRIADNIQPTAGQYAKVIDGTGKHLTAGIIDEHSHIAISNGVNEGTEASSAEVRIGDVVNCDDINIYRQLAGGVTAAQLLHGSANPIGGQSALIKLRWGLAPEQMKIEGADGFIKFALGENVKQANWGDFTTVRFPQTRMGVEQVYYDFFWRAKNYGKLNPATPGFRKDLELDALSEILNAKRFITCHSYVQSEINMLMHVGDSMGFRVNTFTHILEGFKVADKMKAHGANASTFSDWWAYKNEVKDAIPYNAALTTRMGINTCINSDDAEMGRRLNQEAGKTVKYGALTEEEALKLVTLNPAKALHLDNKIGSIKVGKDADVVVWSDNPLSVYAVVENTIIDGVVYFDKNEDAAMRVNLAKEKQRLINKMIAEKKGGAPTSKPVAKKQRLYQCNSINGVEDKDGNMH